MKKIMTNTQIDIAALVRLCQVRDFSRVAKEYNAVALHDKGMHDTWFIDGGKGTKILAVCHFDTVFRGKGQAPVKILRKAGKAIGIESIQLDDRLGAYILLHLLPSLGLKYDVLITTDEEIGRSTAAHFVPTKEYNWTFSFDRRGLYPVMYQYENDEAWATAVDAVQKSTWGTFSDISELDFLGVCGVNWGTAYYGEHTYGCSANFIDIIYVAALFCEFYRQNKNIRYPFTYQPVGYVSPLSGKYWDYDEYEQDYYTRISPRSQVVTSISGGKTTPWATTPTHSTPEVRQLDGKMQILCEYCWEWGTSGHWSDTHAAWLCPGCENKLKEFYALEDNGG